MKGRWVKNGKGRDKRIKSGRTGKRKSRKGSREIRGGWERNERKVDEERESEV